MTCDVTYEELAAYAAGDAPDADRIATHVLTCAACARRLALIRQADGALATLRPETPSPAALLGVRRALAAETRADAHREIMTLDEVADFLRVDAATLDEMLVELPAFELGGVLRVRRARLLEWIDRRERAFARDAARGEVARLLTETPFEEAL